MKTLDETIKKLKQTTENPIEKRILEVFIGQYSMFDEEGLCPESVRDYRREQYEEIAQDYGMNPNSVAQIGTHYSLQFKKITKDYNVEDWREYINKEVENEI